MSRKAVAFVILTVLVSVASTGKDYAVFDVVGDSVSEGINPEYPAQTNRGWVAMLFGTLGSHTTLDTLWPGIVKHNSAVSGSRASQWAEPAYAPMQTVLDHHPDLVIVFIGGNDAIAYAADGAVTPAELQSLRDNLTAIVDRLQANTPPPDIVVVNYYDLFDGFSANLTAPYTAFQFISQATSDGNDIIRQVAEEQGCFLVDTIDDVFLRHAYGNACGDSGHLSPEFMATPFPTSFDIHPVTAGHEAIYTEIFQKLQSMKNAVSRVSDWTLFR